MGPNSLPPNANKRVTSRLYETVADLLSMQAMLMQARSRTSEWRYAHVGELMWNFFMVDCHLNPREFIRLWHDPRGALVAYAILGEDPSFECYVSPGYAWSGIEEEALDWAQARLADLRRREPDRWGEPLVSGARQDDAERIAFLDRHGFRYRGRFSEVNMLRSLAEPTPEPAIPPGCLVRGVVEQDAADRAGAEHDVWLPWSVGNIDGDDYARLMRLPGYERELDIVCVAPDGVIASYVNCWIDPLNRIGDFGPVGARPAYRRRGMTRAVLLEGLHRFQARGMDRACVSTGETNVPARRLYESVGFRVVNRYLDYVRSS